MTSWEEELERLLQKLGVQQEQTGAEQNRAAREPGMVVVQSSVSHPGVAYRIELKGTTCHLYTYVPVHTGPYNNILRLFHVQLADSAFLAHLFALYMTHEGGSDAFQEIEGTCTYSLFMALANTMKALFWLGDQETMQFPPEITVVRLF